MAAPAAPKKTDPFRAWLRSRPTHELAERLGISRQTVNNWKRGTRAHPDRVAAVKLEAAKDGVILTTDQIVGAP